MEKKKGTDKICEEDIGKKFLVYNGRSNIEISVSGLMVGRKFGEFILTRVNKMKSTDKIKGKKKIK